MNKLREFTYPVLQTERLTLRLLTLKDAPAVYQHFSDPEVTKFMDINPCKDVKEAEKSIAEHLEDPGCRWGIFTREVLIGTIGFHCLRDEGSRFLVEIGYDLSTPYWGKGYMTEALEKVLEFGFSEMGADVIDATVEQENERSIYLLNKLGFRLDPELKDGLLYYSLTILAN